MTFTIRGRSVCYGFVKLSFHGTDFGQGHDVFVVTYSFMRRGFPYVVQDGDHWISPVR